MQAGRQARTQMGNKAGTRFKLLVGPGSPHPTCLSPQRLHGHTLLPEHDGRRCTFVRPCHHLVDEKGLEKEGAREGGREVGKEEAIKDPTVSL